MRQSRGRYGPTGLCSLQHPRDLVELAGFRAFLTFYLKFESKPEQSYLFYDVIITRERKFSGILINHAAWSPFFLAGIWIFHVDSVHTLLPCTRG